MEGNPSLALAIPGREPAPDTPTAPLRHSVGPTGDVFLLFPRDAPAVRAVRAAVADADRDDDELAAVLEITDVAPVAVPHRIRGRAWIAGWLTPVPGGAFEAGTELLRLEPGEISVDDLWGTGSVEPDEFALAAPDPLARYETEVLQHLAAAHPAEVALLCGLIAAPDGRCAPRVAGGAVPLALDRFGLRVRFSAESGVFDARFDFPEPVTDLEGARRSMRALFAAARED
ncbi:DUF2470 domain-containing protein [Actinacidiphila sp. ITFR-21]|uniref:DUF2470 domain-containing protein n=1 Tax=Actinacidiphila sp. ITFR-21 TaxID=3075199 RepID=UPI00288B5876|nr:DUF2470 domain-containing protein [Streptomyces sp. ITFR-21]WNI14659.1 DUF2470 domain-containing protein [Streptomyces sp. ITFR-21]